MAINSHRFFQAALIVLQAVPPDGVQEFLLPMAFAQVGLVETSEEAREVVRHLVFAGVLARTPGPRLIPGPEFAFLKAEVERVRSEQTEEASR